MMELNKSIVERMNICRIYKRQSKLELGGSNDRENSRRCDR
jgi:hypothetical protein